MIKPILKQLIRTFAGTVGWQLTKVANKKLIVLMYHRVLPVSDPRYQFEEPGMVVSDKTFAMHMQTLASTKVPVMTVTRWVALADAEKPDLAIAITFDDGWLDNYQFAFPVLKQHDFAATLYVVTDFLGGAAPFWPNRVLRLLLTSTDLRRPEYAPLCELLGEAPATPMSRDDAAHHIAALKQYSDHKIYAALSGIEEVNDRQIEMISAEQLLDAQRKYKVEVGCHTRRHLRLNQALDESTLYEEIIQSKQILEELIDTPVNSFCFPNGDYSPQAFQMVQDHYTNAVTTRRGHNAATAIPHELTRIGVHDDVSGSPLHFKAKLSGLI